MKGFYIILIGYQNIESDETLKIYFEECEYKDCGCGLIGVFARHPERFAHYFCYLVR